METQPQLRQLRNNTTMLFNNQNQPVESVETSVMDSPVTEEESHFIEAKNTPIIEVVNSENKPKHFIEANTKEVSLYHLKNDCIIPVFSKDNEITISHSRFIEALWECTQKLFKNEQIKEPEIRVSHIIKGRTPEAIYKPVKELTDADKTIYYERMAFCMEIPTITEIVGGNTLSLTVGGVRAYNQENLYSKKGIEKFKIFIGFKNMVSDGGNGITIDNKLIKIDPLERESVVKLLEECDEKGFAWAISYDNSKVRYTKSSKFVENTKDTYMKTIVDENLDLDKIDIIYKAYIACTVENINFI